MKCIKCGIENPGDAHFCRYCGHSIQSSVSKEKDIFEYYAYAMKKYAIFEGRASRKEYWSFFLVNIFPSIIPFVGTIYSLAVLIPSLAVAVRRMHDVGVSGWYILIPIYNIVLLCTKGDHFYNEYGGPTV